MSRCPICQSRKSRLMYRINSYKYFYCSKCQMLFLHPLPSARKIRQYYRSDFQYSAGIAEEIRIKKRANIILKKLMQLYPQGKTLLDIGSGYGYFLDEAKRNSLHVTGLEPSKKLYVQSIKRLYTKSIFNQTFEEYFTKQKYKKFDFITLIHIIEHIRNPLQFIRQASQLMNRNGILYIETPNLDSWLAKAEKENYTFLTPPDHIWLLSVKSLQLIVVKVPQLHIESISTYSYPEHLMGIIKNKLKVKSQKSKVTIKNLKLDIDLKLKISNLKLFKYILFDKFIAPLFTPLLNIGEYGSVLELYIKKK